jgi:lipopolysaccharide transport system ATP-binding protein
LVVGSSCLEVETGSNGEMTGRENIYWTEPYLERQKRNYSKLDEIIDFGCERYIDTPVKLIKS